MAVDIIEDENGATLVLEGLIGPEDTDQVLAAIKETPGISVNLAACQHLHTAVLQLLLIHKPAITAMPEDPFWGRCISYASKENEV